MRIKDKKMFVRGILLLLLGVGIAISRFCIFTDATHGMLRPIIFIGICLLAALYHMVMALHIDGEEEGEELETCNYSMEKANYSVCYWY